MNIIQIYHKFPLAELIWRKSIYWISLFVQKFDKFYYAKKDYKAHFGKKLNLKNPKDVIEKFYWIEKYADLSLFAKCADKYAVREFIKERGCGEILNELYAKWDSPDEIDFSVLPDSFILKINNGSGDVTIVKDKKTADKEAIIKHFRELFDCHYGRYGMKDAQFHYTKIHPCIIAEKLLPNDNTDFSCSLIDYKVWCFDGKPECILLCHNRQTGCIYLDLYDTSWNSMGSNLISSHHYQYHPELPVPKPECLDSMLNYASILSKGFPEVRVDFYVVNNKVLFGELTFTTGYGYFTPEFYDYLGEKTNLSIIKTNLDIQ